MPWTSFQRIAILLTGAALSSLSAAVRFEVLSLRPTTPGANLYMTSRPTPNGFRSRLSIWQAIQLAYSPEYDGISGFREARKLPIWSGDFYDVDARVSKADLTAWQHQSSPYELLRGAMRAALAERCKLAVHEEPSTGPNFELVIGKRGTALKAAAPVPADLVGVKLPSGGMWWEIGPKARRK